MANVVGKKVIKANIISNETLINSNVEQTDSQIKSNPMTYNYATTEKAGIIRIATDEEAREGISDNTVITPSTLKQNIKAIEGSELIDVQDNNNTITINSKTFVHEQGISSDAWTIVHNLNKRPSVIAVDTVGRTQIPDEIIYDNDNQLTIQFISAFAGFAYLN